MDPADPFQIHVLKMTYNKYVLMDQKWNQDSVDHYSAAFLRVWTSLILTWVEWSTKI